MGHPRRSRWWTLLAATAVMGMMSALGGTWEAPPGVPPMVTPRGTAPLPPVRTPTAPPAGATPEAPAPAPPAATPTAPGAPVGIAPAPPTVTPAPPEPTATAQTAPAPAAPTATVPAPTAVAAVATATPPRVTPAAQATATPPPAVTATATTAPPGLIAGDTQPPFPPVLPQSVETVIRPGAPAPVALRSADQRVSVAVAGDAVREPVQLTLTAASYGQGQREAALRQGLLLTNVGFSLTAATSGGGVAAPEGEIAVRYTPVQVSGIVESSLGLYRRRAADGAWEAVTGCNVETAERRVVCRAPAAGDFLLAGTKPVAFEAMTQTGAPASDAGSGGSSPMSPLLLVAAGVAALAIAGGAAFVLRGRRG